MQGLHADLHVTTYLGIFSGHAGPMLSSRQAHGHSLPSSVPQSLQGQGQPSGQSLLPPALGTADVDAATFPLSAQQRKQQNENAAYRMGENICKSYL